MGRTPLSRTLLRAVGAVVGFSVLPVLAGCFAATPASGMVLSLDQGTCVPTGAADEYFLLVPIIASTDYETTGIYSLQLLEPTNLEIEGYELVSDDVSAESTPVPTELIEQVKGRGTGVTPTPELTGTEPANLAVLLRSNEDSDAAARGLRIEWTVGEPIYFQDDEFSVAVSTSCELDVPSRSASLSLVQVGQCQTSSPCDLDLATREK